MKLPFDDLYHKKIQQIRLYRSCVCVNQREYSVFALFLAEFAPTGAYVSHYYGQWHHGKSINIVGLDERGDFYYRCADGSIRYYHHIDKIETYLFNSEREFLYAIQPINEY